MGEQVATTVQAYGAFTAAKQAKTGLIDVTVDVYSISPAGVVTTLHTALALPHPATPTGGGEIGTSGIYRIRIPASEIPAECDLLYVFHTADATVDAKDVFALVQIGHGGIENLDAPVSGAVTEPEVEALLSAIAGGGGSVFWTHHVADSNNDPLGGVLTWVTATNDREETPLVELVTNSDGDIRPRLDPGTRYFWHKKDGYSFDSDPTIENVS